MRRWLGQNGLPLLLALLGPLAMAAVLLPVRGQVANTQVALVLVVVIVAIAAAGHRLAGILAAVSAGIWFDFFYTRPFQNFSITGRADLETFVLLVIVGVAVTELAVWGRRQQAIASRQAGYLDGIHTASEVGATGGEPTTLIRSVADQLVATLGLRGCRFQRGISGVGNPPRLLRDGQVVWNREVWDVERRGLPTERPIELLVQSGGRLHGRFLLSAPPDARPPVAQRLVAVTLADQVGSALDARL